MPKFTQKDLYLANRARLQAPGKRCVGADSFERDWIAQRISECGVCARILSLFELTQALSDRVALEQKEASAESAYVAHEMQIDEFRILVQEFAVDGLTEAQVFYHVLPRLPLEAQMPLLRIMIDEFGSGNINRAHTTLYVELLRELDMTPSLDFYQASVGETSLEFVNLFFWLALRADDCSYFAGALTYLEASIPVFFECYAQACRRLGVRASAYYTEHQHIDKFHAVEGRRLLSAMAASGVLDADKAHRGALLTSHITDIAFRSAVAKARSSPDRLRHRKGT